MPSETGSRAGCPQRQESQERTYKVPRETDRRRGRQQNESQERTYKVPRETDGRHGRQQNISVSGRHYSAVRSQKILGKAWDAPRDRETGSWEGAYRMPGRQEVE
ncbi:hypothetical protein BGX38DRAFT_1147318 [Terfezia claveryi]|nr:hypothetical protein BGX38DRAFT_1147318 [Terfezia claveryi]